MMKQIVLFFSLVLFSMITGWAQKPVLLYPQGMPDSNGLDSVAMKITPEVAFGVTCPDYYLMLPDQAKANGQAVLICPGGGYGCVCYDREGLQVGRWFNDHGIAAVVLRYRMPNGHHEIPIEDVRTALSVMNRHAGEWNVDPHQIGIMGFSAGGHLAATAATLITEDSLRPAFAVLIYPVISMQSPYMHEGSRNNLMGVAPSPELTDKYSCERQVTSGTPPCFIALSHDDEVVQVENSLIFYDSLRSKGVSAELHIYPSGRHGWIDRFVYDEEYHASLLRWLAQQRDSTACVQRDAVRP